MNTLAAVKAALRGLREKPVAQMLAIGIVASIVGTALSLWIDWFPSQASAQADDVDRLYDWLLIASVPVFVLVMTVAIYSVVKFRAQPGDERDGEPIHGDAKLEFIWVVVPFVIVSALSVYAWVALVDQEERKPNTLVVKVISQQFAWAFEYPQPSGPPVRSEELLLPLGRPVEFRVESKDVIHSFFVPDFRVKQDAVPGNVSATNATPSKVGSFPIVCAELCGLGHSTMRQTVRVMPPSEFTAWLDDEKLALDEGEATGLAAGRQLYSTAGCAGCHTLADAGAEAATGPPLDGLAEVAAKRDPKQTLKEYVRESIEDPNTLVVKGYRPLMPPNYRSQLSSKEIESLVDYLAGVSVPSGSRPAGAASTAGSANAAR